MAGLVLEVSESEQIRIGRDVVLQIYRRYLTGDKVKARIVAPKDVAIQREPREHCGIERRSSTVLCPHCGQESEHLRLSPLETGLGTRVVCPHCNKLWVVMVEFVAPEEADGNRR